MSKESKILLEKAINSLILSIEFFNRPWDRGRVEAVLILFDHSFELLLKSSILSDGGKIRKKRENQTIGFDECVRLSIDRKIITKEQGLTLQTINGLRDAAQHHIVYLSEQHLYIQTQAGLTLFKDLVKKCFHKDLLKELPQRVLPLSTTVPVDSIEMLYENDVENIKQLLNPRRKKIEAIARLRGLAIFDGAIRGEKIQPPQAYLNKLAKGVQEGKKWSDLFPGVASINLVPIGEGPNVTLRISKKEGIPITLVPEGTPGAMTIGVKTVNELGFYNLSLTQLAEKIGLTRPKTTAMVEHLKLKGNSKYHKELVFGKVTFNRYSQEAITQIKDELSKVSIDNIWNEYRQKRYKKRSINGK